MKVYCDFVTGEEFFSDAKTLEPVTMVEDGVTIDTGFVRCAACPQTAGGLKLDIGGGSGAAAGYGGESAGRDEDEGVDDREETKLDQFWTFPSIENEQTYSSFASFKKDYFMPFLVTFQKLAVKKGIVPDEATMKTVGKKLANGAMKWIKANFDNLQFFGLETFVLDGSEVGSEFEGLTFVPNVAYVKYEEDGTPYFYFLIDTFKAVRN